MITRTPKTSSAPKAEPTADELPSKKPVTPEPAPAPDRKCDLCHRIGTEADPVTKDIWHMWLHFSCKVRLGEEVAKWRAYAAGSR
jgi:hypothetical protein